MESSDEKYYTDIQIIMDFMKLSWIIDDKSIDIEYKREALKLQKGLLRLLQVAQSNRIAMIYKKLHTVYMINQDTIGQKKNNNLNYNIILFYDSECPSYKKMSEVWDNFKSINIDNNLYGIVDLDIRDIIYSEKKNIQLTQKQMRNKELFKRFNIQKTPTIAAVNMNNGKGLWMEQNITLENIHKFVSTFVNRL